MLFFFKTLENYKMYWHIFRKIKNFELHAVQFSKRTEIFEKGTDKLIKKLKILRNNSSSF